MKIVKAASVFTLIFFALSLTGAAATLDMKNKQDDNANYKQDDNYVSGHDFKKCIVKAKDDVFNFNAHKNKGNVLKNDIGKSLVIIKVSKSKNGVHVKLRRNGDFTYEPSNVKHKDTIKDSFTYAIKDKNCGKISTAKVVINFKINNKHD